MSGPFGSSQWMYASGGFYDFPISNSLRFEDGDSAYLGFTPSSAGNRRTWTWSSWVKLSNLGTAKTLFGSGTASSNDNTLDHTDGSIFYFYDRVAAKLFLTDAVYRDPSAWYNVVFVADTTNSTAGDRLRLFVNGVRQDGASGSNYPDQNTDLGINNNVTHFIGARKRTNIENFYDGYLAETCFIDGTALAPSSFGETKNDIWIPKDTSGLTFGDQGWRLQYKQTGTGTAGTSTIGADTSGEGNHWTSTNLVASDVVPDSPTNNFATLNALSTLGTVALSEGNLKVQIGGSNAVDQAFPTFALPTTGKWYCEVGVVTIASGYSAIGLSASSERGSTGQLPRHGYLQDGQKIAYSTKSSYGNSFANGDVLGIAVDRDNRKLYFAKNGTWQASGDPVAGNNAAFTSITQENNLKVILYNATTSGTAGATTFVFNAGQDSSFAGTETAQGNADGNGIGDFYYAPPTGFLALCTANLPDPVETIDPAQGGSPQDYFNTVLYSGNSSTQAITGVGFQPDFTWSKTRNVADHHILVDSVRGDKALRSNGTNAEYDTGVSWQFDSDGFTMTGTTGELNYSGRTYATWNWKLNGTGAANTDGTINTTATTVAAHGGTSISTYTGDGNDNATIGHGLSGTPELVIIKPRNYSDNWVISWGNGNGMAGLTSGDYIYFTTGAAGGASNGRFLANDSDTVNLGTNWNNINKDSSSTYVMYCFRSIDGMQKIGTYTGNGNADGPFVYTGFRPAVVIYKRTDSGADWHIYDNKRDPFNEMDLCLFPSGNYADSAGDALDFLSNGFKQRNTGGEANASGGTYIYMAFAEQSQKFANAK